MTAPRPPRTERQVRTDLAAAYRLAALNGWDNTVYTHLSATVPGEPGVYLINEFGLGFDEVTASGLVKVDVHGRVADGSARPVNPTGFTIHGAVHAARPDYPPGSAAKGLGPRGQRQYACVRRASREWRASARAGRSTRRVLK